MIQILQNSFTIEIQSKHPLDQVQWLRLEIMDALEAIIDNAYYTGNDKLSTRSLINLLKEMEYEPEHLKDLFNKDKENDAGVTELYETMLKGKDDLIDTLKMCNDGQKSIITDLSKLLENSELKTLATQQS